MYTAGPLAADHVPPAAVARIDVVTPAAASASPFNAVASATTTITTTAVTVYIGGVAVTAGGGSFCSFVLFSIVSLMSLSLYAIHFSVAHTLSLNVSVSSPVSLWLSIKRCLFSVALLCHPLGFTNLTTEHL